MNPLIPLYMQGDFVVIGKEDYEVLLTRAANHPPPAGDYYWVNKCEYENLKLSRQNALDCCYSQTQRIADLQNLVERLSSDSSNYCQISKEEYDRLKREGMSATTHSRLLDEIDAINEVSSARAFRLQQIIDLVDSFR